MGSSNAAPPESSDESSSPPPPSTSPPPKDSSPPPPSSPPPSSPSPPPPSKSPPPEKSSPPPSPPAGSPPPPQNSSPPPSPPSSPPPAPAKKSPPAPITSETPPAPAVEVTFSPPPPVEAGGVKPTPPAGVVVKSPPAPAVPASETTSSSPEPGDGSASSGSSSGSSIPGVAVAAVVVGGLVLFMFLVCLWVFCKRKKKSQEYYNKVWNTPSPAYKHHAIHIPGGLVGPPPLAAAHMLSKPPLSGGPYSPYLYPNLSPSPMVPFSPDRGGGGFNNQNCLSYDEVAAATDGFADSNLLGQGGFGLVHKGVMPGGKVVAVKSLKSGSGQGEREFQAEVDIISRVHHRHLVSLVGYCIAAEKRLLVYEFVPNNTLEYHLHKSGNSPLDFSRRVRIALGSAKGLAYLHEDCHPRIIHRDIKAANILLDYNFEAQVADFGLAKLYNDTSTHVSTRVMGTFGYLAPEYASSGKLTDKSDVFSFGVVLLELITGRRPIDPSNLTMEEDYNLVDWARPLLAKALAEGKYDELVDHRLEHNYNAQEMATMVACAAASIRHSGRRRPRMSQIVRTLEGNMSLEALDGRRIGQSETYDTAAYSADLRNFKRMAFASQTYGSTSEYGLNPSASSSNVTSPRHSI